MVFSVRRAVRFTKMLLIFIVLTCLIYRLITAGAVWFQQDRKYKAPAGSAVKVFQQEALQEEQWTFVDRVKRFYLYGG